MAGRIPHFLPGLHSFSMDLGLTDLHPRYGQVAFNFNVYFTTFFWLILCYNLPQGKKVDSVDLSQTITVLISSLLQIHHSDKPILYTNITFQPIICIPKGCGLKIYWVEITMCQSSGI